MRSTPEISPDAGKPGGVLIVSAIAAAKGQDGGWQVLDLWARDVNVQAQYLPVALICPVQAYLEGSTAPLSPRISIVDANSSQSMERAVCEADFIQLPGNSGWQASAMAREVLALARIHDKAVFLGISSNRARTVLLNGRGKGILRYARALLRYVDIRYTQRWLARRVTGVFLVGEGLVPLVRGCNPNLHVGTASWITREDVHSAVSRPAAGQLLRICMAGRLERMKGFHVGIDALAVLPGSLIERVTLIGSGPEQTALQRQAQRTGLTGFQWCAPVPYPKPFFALLREHDLVLLTNLSDEQPRLVFDALCCGVLPICPDTPAYRALGLERQLLYRQGDMAALAECILQLADAQVRKELFERNARVLDRHTIETMHEERLAWMAGSSACRRAEQGGR